MMALLHRMPDQASKSLQKITDLIVDRRSGFNWISDKRAKP